MKNTMFISAQEMAENLGISKSSAYKLVRQLNDQLKEQGFFVISGKVSRSYYEEKFYGIKEVPAHAGIQG